MNTNETMPAKMYLVACLMAVITAVLLLSACGGGGGEDASSTKSGSASSTLASTPSSSTPTSSSSAQATSFAMMSGLPSTTSLAAGNNISQLEVDVLNRINTIRSAASLSPVWAEYHLNIAAQKHTAYQLETDIYGHYQGNTSAANYTGAGVSDRISVQGYPWSRLLEVTAAAKPAKSSIELHDMLIDTVYHRLGMLRHDLVDVGIGYLSKSNGGVLTLDYGRSKALALTPPAGGAPVKWPVDGQINVPTSFASDTEAPDPVPDQNIVGYPITFQVYPEVSFTPVRFRLFEVTPSGDVEVTNTRVLSSANDKNIDTYAATLIPMAPLKAAKRYTVIFEGNVDGAPVTARWQFTTA